MLCFCDYRAVFSANLDSNDGIYNREDRYYKRELFHRFPIAPKTLLGIFLVVLVPIFIAKAIARRERFIFLVLAFVMAQIAGCVAAPFAFSPLDLSSRLNDITPIRHR
jgi:hypothetical protein